MRNSLLTLLPLLAACSRPPTVASAPTPAPIVVPADVVIPAPEPADVPAADATAEPVDVPRPVSPHETLLRELAAGRQSIAAHADPAQGVLVVEYVEAGPGPGARAVRRARRLCGAAIARDRDLPRMLRDAIAQAEHFELGCEGDTCTVQGMEYAPVWRVTFAGDAVTSVMRLSEAAMSEDYLTTRDAYVRRQIDAQRARACPGAPR